MAGLGGALGLAVTVAVNLTGHQAEVEGLRGEEVFGHFLRRVLLHFASAQVNTLDAIALGQPSFDEHPFQAQGSGVARRQRQGRQVLLGFGRLKNEAKAQARPWRHAMGVAHRVFHLREHRAQG